MAEGLPCCLAKRRGQQWALVMAPAFTTTSGFWDQTRINPLPGFFSGICLTDVIPCIYFPFLSHSKETMHGFNFMSKVVGFAWAVTVCPANQGSTSSLHFSPSSLSPPGLTYSYGKDPGGTRFPSQPQAWARGGRGADALSPPAPLSPAALPAAPTCFALNGAGAAGGLFRPRPREVAGGARQTRLIRPGPAHLGRGQERLLWAPPGRGRAGPDTKYGDGRGRIPRGRSLPPPAVIKGSAAAAAATSDPARSGSLSLCPTRAARSQPR